MVLTDQGFNEELGVIAILVTIYLGIPLLVFATISPVDRNCADSTDEMPSGRIAYLYQLPSELLGVLLSPTARPLASEERNAIASILTSVDWSAIAEDANSHVLGILLYQRLAEQGLLKYLPDSVNRSLEIDALHGELQHAIHRQDALLLSRKFSQRNVRHAFIKGFAYRNWLYQPAWVRLGGDVDILIDRHNVELVRHLMREEGFVQAAYSADHQHFRPAGRDEIARVERAHHELAEFTKDHILVNAPDWLLGTAFKRRSPFAFGMLSEGPVLHSSFDVHWAIHFLFANATPLDHVVIASDPDGSCEPIPVLRVEWNIIISAFKLYFEAFDRPRYGFNHLVDLIALLQRAPAIDWGFLCDLTRLYRLEAALFYTLSAAQMISRNRLVPSSILERLSELDQETAISRDWSLVDYGDFIPYLAGRRIATSFAGHKQQQTI